MRTPLLFSFKLWLLPWSAVTTASVTVPAISSTPRIRTSASSTFFSWTSFIDSDRTVLDGLSVQTVNGGLSFFCAGHFNKAKSSGFTSKFIFDDCHRCNLTERAECVPYIIFGRFSRQVSYIYVHGLCMFPFLLYVVFLPVNQLIFWRSHAPISYGLHIQRPVICSLFMAYHGIKQIPCMLPFGHFAPDHYSDYPG